MLVFRDTSSIRGAPGLLPDLAGPLAKRFEELSEFDDCELDQLVNIVVAQPGDRLADLDVAVGFPLSDRAPDAIESHPHWFELTYVVSDDGFGVVLYVPDDPDIDGPLRQLCVQHTRARG
jgi:hypothetical protein